MATQLGGGDSENITAIGGVYYSTGFDDVSLDGLNLITPLVGAFEGDGADVQIGDGGSFLIVGGDNANITAGAGDDVVYFGTGSTVAGANIELGDGDNRVGGSNLVGADISGTGNATLNLDNSSGNTLDFSGADEVQAQVSGDGNVIKTGAGDDALAISGDGNVALGGAGNDAVTSNGDGGLVGGSSGDKNVALTGTKSLALTGTGDDVINSSGGNKLYGNEGNDTMYGTGGTGNDTFSGGAGNDVIVSGGDSKITGNEGADTVYANGGDTVGGGDGNDKIYAQGGSKISGDEGNDYISGYFGSGGDTLIGGEGNDYILSGVNSVVQGGAGSDTIIGNAGDSLYGGSKGQGDDGASDFFVLTPNFGHETIFDLQVGANHDYLYIQSGDYNGVVVSAGANVSSYAAQTGTSVTITIGDSVLVLKNFKLADLDSLAKFT